MPRRSRLPSLLALLLAAPLAAQAPTGTRRPPSDSVPRELVQALLPSADGLRVGEPAGDLPRELLPPNGIVLGSMESGGSSTTLVVLMQPEHEAIAAHEARARAAGWAPPAAPTGMPLVEEELRGFLPSGYGARGSLLVVGSSSMGGGVGTTRAVAAARLCRGSTMLTASSSPWSGGRTLLRLQSMHAAEYSPCRPRTPEAPPEQLVRRVTVYDSIIPALRPPAAAQVQPRGASSGMSEWSARVAIETAMPIAELLAHYAAEMAREGWAPVGDAAATSAAAVQVWRKADAKGRPWHASISLTGAPGARRVGGELRLERDGTP